MLFTCWFLPHRVGIFSLELIDVLIESRSCISLAHGVDSCVTCLTNGTLSSFPIWTSLLDTHRSLWPKTVSSSQWDGMEKGRDGGDATVPMNLPFRVCWIDDEPIDVEVGMMSFWRRVWWYQHMTEVDRDEALLAERFLMVVLRILVNYSVEHPEHLLQPIDFCSCLFCSSSGDLSRLVFLTIKSTRGLSGWEEITSLFFESAQRVLTSHVSSYGYDVTDYLRVAGFVNADSAKVVCSCQAHYGVPLSASVSGLLAEQAMDTQSLDTALAYVWSGLAELDSLQYRSPEAVLLTTFLRLLEAKSLHGLWLANVNLATPWQQPEWSWQSRLQLDEGRLSRCQLLGVRCCPFTYVRSGIRPVCTGHGSSLLVSCVVVSGHGDMTEEVIESSLFSAPPANAESVADVDGLSRCLRRFGGGGWNGTSSVEHSGKASSLSKSPCPPCSALTMLLAVSSPSSPHSCRVSSGCRSVSMTGNNRSVFLGNSCVSTSDVQGEADLSDAAAGVMTSIAVSKHAYSIVGRQAVSSHCSDDLFDMMVPSASGSLGDDLSRVTGSSCSIGFNNDLFTVKDQSQVGCFVDITNTPPKKGSKQSRVKGQRRRMAKGCNRELLIPLGTNSCLPDEHNSLRSDALQDVMSSPAISDATSLVTESAISLSHVSSLTKFVELHSSMRWSPEIEVVRGGTERDGNELCANDRNVEWKDLDLHGDCSGASLVKFGNLRLPRRNVRLKANVEDGRNADLGVTNLAGLVSRSQEFDHLPSRRITRQRVRLAECRRKETAVCKSIVDNKLNVMKSDIDVACDDLVLRHQRKSSVSRKSSSRDNVGQRRRQGKGQLVSDKPDIGHKENVEVISHHHHLTGAGGVSNVKDEWNGRTGVAKPVRSGAPGDGSWKEKAAGVDHRRNPTEVVAGGSGVLGREHDVVGREHDVVGVAVSASSRPVMSNTRATARRCGRKADKCAQKDVFNMEQVKSALIDSAGSSKTCVAGVNGTGKRRARPQSRTALSSQSHGSALVQSFVETSVAAGCMDVIPDDSLVADGELFSNGRPNSTNTRATQLDTVARKLRFTRDLSILSDTVITYCKEDIEPQLIGVKGQMKSQLTDVQLSIECSDIDVDRRGNIAMLKSSTLNSDECGKELIYKEDSLIVDGSRPISMDSLISDSNKPISMEDSLIPDGSSHFCKEDSKLSNSSSHFSSDSVTSYERDVYSFDLECTANSEADVKTDSQINSMYVSKSARVKRGKVKKNTCFKNAGEMVLKTPHLEKTLSSFSTILTPQCTPFPMYGLNNYVDLCTPSFSNQSCDSSCKRNTNFIGKSKTPKIIPVVRSKNVVKGTKTGIDRSLIFIEITFPKWEKTACGRSVFSVSKSSSIALHNRHDHESSSMELWKRGSSYKANLPTTTAHYSTNSNHLSPHTDRGMCSLLIYTYIVCDSFLFCNDFMCFLDSIHTFYWHYIFIYIQMEIWTVDCIALLE